MKKKMQIEAKCTVESCEVFCGMGTSLFYKRLGRGDGAVHLLIFSSLFYFDPCDCVFLFVSVFVYLILVQRERDSAVY